MKDRFADHEKREPTVERSSPAVSTVADGQRCALPACGWLPVAAVVVAVLTAPVCGVAGTIRLDADTAVRRALEVSNIAAAAAERVAGAVSGVAEADASRLPVVGAGASIQRLSGVPDFIVNFDPSAAALNLFPDIRTDYGLSLDVTQPLYTGGAVTSSREAARHQLSATHADERVSRAAIRLRARLVYWRAAAALASVSASESQQRRAARLLDDARSLRQAGMAVEADVLAAEARRAATHLAVIRTRAAAGEAMASLRSLLHVPDATAIKLADTMPVVLPPRPEPLSTLQQRALQRRPEVVALEARIQFLAAQREIARAAARPEVRATAQWNLARPNHRYLPLKDEWNDSWAVGLVARWSLWNGGRTTARAATIRAQERALEEELTDVKRRIDLDVVQARLQLASALAAVPASAVSRKAAAARLAAVEDRYKAGLATTSDVLDAQADLAAAEARQVEARTGAWIAEARLDWAVNR